MKPEEIREYKQVILIRADAGMDCGKKCVQVAHAAVMGADAGVPYLTEKWRKNGMRKIVLKVPDLPTMVRITNKAAMMGINSAIVSDAGLTQLAPGTTTAVGFEPLSEGSAALIDLTTLTKDLKLL